MIRSFSAPPPRIATTAFALQPATCGSVATAEEPLTEKETADQALIDAFVYHRSDDEQPAGVPEHGEQQDNAHASGDEESAGGCH